MSGNVVHININGTCAMLPHYSVTIDILAARVTWWFSDQSFLSRGEIIHVDITGFNIAVTFSVSIAQIYPNYRVAVDSGRGCDPLAPKLASTLEVERL